MKLPRNAKIFRGQLDAAPFAGVMFLLLIFLALNSRLVFYPGHKIDLAEVGNSVPGTPNRTVVVAIDAAGLLYYDSQAIPEEKLMPKLKAVVQSSKDPVTLEILADKAGKLEATMRLMSLAREIGFQQVHIDGRPATRPIPQGKQAAR